MTPTMKKVLIIGGIAIIAIAAVIGVVISLPSGGDDTTTTTTSTSTTVTTAKPNGGNDTTTTTTTTTKPNEGTTTTTTTTKPKEDEPDPHEHVEEVIPGKAATCTETGLTDGVKCSVCGETLTAQTVIPKTPHTETTVKGTAATCTKEGLTDGTKCSVCGEVIVAQTAIPTVAHTYDDKYDDTCNICGFVRDAECAHTNTEKVLGKAATCTSTGLTDGEKCSKCGEILVAQTVIPKKDHTESDWITDANATCTTNGSKHKECTVCHATLSTGEIAKTGHAYGSVVTPPTCQRSGYTTYTCSRCGDMYRDDYTPTVAHNYEAVETVPATCSSDGYTIYACSMCGDFEYRDHTDKLSHTPGTWTVTKDPTREEEGERRTYCTTCGALMTEAIPAISDPSEGLQFTLNSDGASYSVSGIGECKDTVVTIPSEYRGLPVTEIASNAFYENQSIKKVILPSSIVQIGNSAFANCKSLYTVELSENLKIIGEQAFQFSGLVYITLPASLESIKHMSFANCPSLIEVCNLSSISEQDLNFYGSIYFNCKNKITDERNSKIREAYGMLLYENGEDKYIMRYIKDSDTLAIGLGDYWADGYEIYSSAFYGNTTLKTVSILRNITAIGASAFEKCTALESVTFTDSVQSIGSRAFAFTGSFDIYYQSTADKWNAIDKESFLDYQDSGSITVYVDNGNGQLTPLN